MVNVCTEWFEVAATMGACLICIVIIGSSSVCGKFYIQNRFEIAATIGAYMLDMYYYY